MAWGPTTILSLSFSSNLHHLLLLANNNNGNDTDNDDNDDDNGGDNSDDDDNDGNNNNNHNHLISINVHSNILTADVWLLLLNGLIMEVFVFTKNIKYSHLSYISTIGI